MTENLKKFLEYVDANAELKEKAKELKAENPEEAIKIAVAFAKENGFELTEADFEATEGELSENELSDVAGGLNFCACVFAGGGGGKDDDGQTFGCVCALYGQGGDAGDDNWLCLCIAGGAGGGAYDGEVPS